jgi:ATP-dependent DNA helicase RecG
MTESNDGFVLSEVDLKLRGPGDMMGTRQSGLLEFKIADLVKDQEILLHARKLAAKIVQKDPELALDENKKLAKSVNQLLNTQRDWSKIS